MLRSALAISVSLLVTLSVWTTGTRFVFGETAGTSSHTQVQEHTDWPSVISQLQQELYRRPGHTHTRMQLATAYNNYGVSLGEQEQWSMAIQQLEEAIRLDKTNLQFQQNLSRIYLNQAHEAYTHHRSQEAKTLLERAIEWDPQLAPAYAMLGEIEYDSQRLSEAKAAWERAMALDPTIPDLAQRLSQVTEELPLESEFERLTQAFFDLRFEEQLQRPVGFDIRDALLLARREVGQDFAYWPKYKIVVLVYSAESFKKLRAEVPEWVAGQFDGKIRVPLPDKNMAPEMVRRIVFHEYTHALIHDLSRGRCPVWFNEGLAEYEGNRQLTQPFKNLARAFANDQIVPWNEMNRSFDPSQPADTVTLGYQQAHSIVQYLIERHGLWRIRRILKTLGEGKSLEEIISKELHTKPDRLITDWKRWLSENLSS